MLSDRLPNAANVVEFLTIELRGIIGLSVCFFTPPPSISKKVCKVRFSQASIKVIVSFKESDHCFGALCDVITMVHEFRLGCSERRFSRPCL